MIEAERLTKRYGSVTAIEDISFQIEKGEIIGFLGPNAAGKTTTMRILTGFSPPSSGTARVAGFDITQSPLEVKRRVGYLPENVPLYTDMLVSGFLDYVAQVKAVPRNRRPSEVGRVMERCGLTHMARRTVGHLSKGYRQRVGLAQALIGSPPVLILDEPTVGLDPAQIVEIRNVIKDLASSHTVLLSTHILPEVSMLCERVLIVNEGRLVAQDTMQRLAAGDGAEGRQVEVQVAGSGDGVDRTLQGAPHILAVTGMGGGRFVVNVAQEAPGVAPVVERLVGAGLEVLTVQERQRGLEEAFLDAISRDASREVRT